MSKAADSTTKDGSGKRQFTAGSVGLQLLDTTWRIAVPVLLFAAIGIMIDLKLGTKPWVTLVMVVFGFVVAGWLVKRQIEAVEKEESNKS